MTEHTDRELLELAAKAAGMSRVKESAFREGGYVVQTHENEWTAWNPIADDGDALRLAVKCRFVVDTGSASVSVHQNNGLRDIGFEWKNDDPYAATRRAIVRAAAELGAKT